MPKFRRGGEDPATPADAQALDGDPGAGAGAGPEPLPDSAYDKFGGVNIGAAFFGWMVAVGMTVLLTGLLGALLALLDEIGGVDDLSAQTDLTTAGLVSAVVVLVVLLLAYYCGGYVAGRMSRFDGGRQGFVVWLLALVFAVLAGGIGWAAGERYDLLAGADLPTVSVATQDLTLAGVISLVVVLLGTLLAAMVGGKVGRRYHARVDRAL